MTVWQPCLRIRTEYRCPALLKYFRPTMKTLWNYSKIALKLLWNCSENTLKQLRNCAKTALNLLRNCSKTALKLLWNSSEIGLETALKLLCNCTGESAAKRGLINSWNAIMKKYIYKFYFLSYIYALKLL